MPLGVGDPAALSRAAFVPSSETEARIVAAFGPLRAVAATDPSDEARNTRLPDAVGTIGFISPVSRPYCGTCNRMRLTADGKFHLCLLNDDELDVRRAIRSRSGRELEEVAEILVRAVSQKPTGHHLLEGRSTRDRSMYQIGG